MEGSCGRWGAVAWVFAATVVAACWSGAEPQSADYLIRVGQTAVTVQDFRVAFEVAKVAYPHNALQDPAVDRGMRRRLLSQLTDELVILERARVLGVEVSDVDVAEAIETVKADYPAQMFQRTLHESAISLADWESRLKVRLMIERVIERDLTQQVEITSSDVIAYYRLTDLSKGDIIAGDGPVAADKASVREIRRIKAERSYDEWLKQLRKVHRIDINRKLWQEISE